MSTHERTIWHLVQVLTCAAGMFIWGALFLRPALGLHLLWNVLIPVAPALLVIAPGVWRNVCPLGSLSLAPHHFGLSLRRRLSPAWRGRLYLGALVLLIVVVPLRKGLLDTNGPVLATILGAVGVLAIWLGMVFTQKSSWCSSLCPVYPVELLYGSRPLMSVPNTHCPQCSQCVTPCSESTPGLTPSTAVNTELGRAVGIVLTGCFPGFVWGWYNVPTYSGWEGVRHLHIIYGVPYSAGALTLALFLVLRRIRPKEDELFVRMFAAAAIITYYWFRLPSIFGIGDASAALIVDVSPWLPSWSTTALRISVLVVFTWLMVIREGKQRAWEIHPATVQTLNIPAGEGGSA
ncbi:MAG: hypothetical protein GY758_04995 [Fuerstiella sp.]|nr:hypothetical protein [Fuerstiella sp.]MCP4784454.1 hypothetical protein [Fuerstiella sp.]MCP4859428.1 hypothetical protein [Fuerstiella sp.]